MIAAPAMNPIRVALERKSIMKPSLQPSVRHRISTFQEKITKFRRKIPERKRKRKLTLGILMKLGRGQQRRLRKKLAEETIEGHW